MINIIVRIVRTKAMALMLGPAGFGLAGLYGAIESLTENIAGMGVNSSGVRQIAAAVGTGDTKRIAQTAAVLRRTSILLGIVGAILLIAFSKPVSLLTFGTNQHSSAICLLSFAVFLQLVSYGQAALIQGMRRIGDLAKMTVLGGTFGTLISIPVVYFLRENGVVLSLVILAATTIVTSWWYSRKIQIDVPSITVPEIVTEGIALLNLGSVFMASGLMLTGISYLVRILILRKVGFEATGLYQSAWTLGGLYVGFIIQAMGADFYPRLTANAQDNAVCNRLVNEQARIALLLAGPGALATLTFAPIVITILYTAKFSAAVGILRWICLGTTLQTVTWPMSFIIVAKAKRAIFFWAELACALVYATLTWTCICFFGLNGAGIAFFAYCIFHGFLHYPIVRRLTGFSWSIINKQMSLIFFGLIAVVFCGFYVFPLAISISLGVVATLASSICSMRVLLDLISWNRVPRPVQRLIVGLGWASSKTAIDTNE
jgi:antigen flippase